MFKKADSRPIIISVLKKSKPTDKDADTTPEYSPRKAPRLSPRRGSEKSAKVAASAAGNGRIRSKSEPGPCTEPKVRAVTRAVPSQIQPAPNSILQEAFAAYGAVPSFFDLMNSPDAPVLSFSPPKDFVIKTQLGTNSPRSAKQVSDDSQDSPLKRKRKVEQIRSHSIATDHVIKRRKDGEISPRLSPRVSPRTSPRTIEPNTAEATPPSPEKRGSTTPREMQ